MEDDDSIGFVVVVKSDGSSGGRMPVSTDVTFGRDAKVDVRIRLQTVSKLAARLVAEDGKVFFINESGTNPVELNGHPAPSGSPVCVGHCDTFSFAGRVFRFEYANKYVNQAFAGSVMRNPPAKIEQPISGLDETVAMDPLRVRSALTDHRLSVLNSSATIGLGLVTSTQKALQPKAGWEAPTAVPSSSTHAFVGAAMLQPVLSHVYPTQIPLPMLSSAVKPQPLTSAAATSVQEDENMEPEANLVPVCMHTASHAPARPGTPTLVPQLQAGSPLGLGAAPTPLRPLASAQVRDDGSRTPAKSAMKKARVESDESTPCLPLGGMGSPSAMLRMATSALVSGAAAFGLPTASLGMAIGMGQGARPVLPTPVAKFLKSRRVSYGVSAVALIPANGDERYSLLCATGRGDGERTPEAQRQGEVVQQSSGTPMAVDTPECHPSTLSLHVPLPAPIDTPRSAAVKSKSALMADISRRRRSYGSSMPKGKVLPEAQSAEAAAASSAAASVQLSGVDEDGDYEMGKSPAVLGGAASSAKKQRGKSPAEAVVAAAREEAASPTPVPSHETSATPVDVVVPSGHVLFDSEGKAQPFPLVLASGHVLFDSEGKVMVVLDRGMPTPAGQPDFQHEYVDDGEEEYEAEDEAEDEQGEEQGEEEEDEVENGVISCTGNRGAHLFFSSPPASGAAPPPVWAASHPSFDTFYGMDAEGDTADEEEVHAALDTAVAAAAGNKVAASAKSPRSTIFAAITSRRKSYGAKEAVGKQAAAASARPVKKPAPAPTRAAPSPVPDMSSLRAALGGALRDIVGRKKSGRSAVPAASTAAAGISAPLSGAARGMLPAALINAIALRRKSAVAPSIPPSASVPVSDEGGEAPPPPVLTRRGLPTPLRAAIQGKRKSGGAPLPMPAIDVEVEVAPEAVSAPPARKCLPTPLRAGIQARRRSAASLPAPDPSPVPMHMPSPVEMPMHDAVDVESDSPPAPAPLSLLVMTDMDEAERNAEVEGGGGEDAFLEPSPGPWEDEDDPRYHRGNRSAIYNNSANKHKRLSTVMETDDEEEEARRAMLAELGEDDEEGEGPSRSKAAAARRRRQTVTPKKKARQSLGGAGADLPTPTPGSAGSVTAFKPTPASSERGQTSTSKEHAPQSVESKGKGKKPASSSAAVATSTPELAPLVPAAKRSDKKKEAEIAPAPAALGGKPAPGVEAVAAPEPARPKRGVAAPAPAPSKGKGKAKAAVVEPEATLEEEEADPPCATCGKYATGRNPCIICDACEGWYHFKCLSMSSRDVPEGDWRCPACEEAKEKAGKGKRKGGKTAPLPAPVPGAGSKRARANEEPAPVPVLGKGKAKAEEAGAEDEAAGQSKRPRRCAPEPPALLPADMSAAELRVACGEAGLDTTGTKAVMIDRLEQHTCKASRKAGGKKGAGK